MSIKYRVSGIYRNQIGTITDYQVHKIENGRETIQKVNKGTLIFNIGMSTEVAKTYQWDYANGDWIDGEEIEIIKGDNDYLRTNPNNKKTDNLGNLIDYSKAI
ncbi:DUF3892 domain-containing protein [Bernardetia sp. ABR2-2B]|uniref:DUF3892 domain-containing protein n=1 Tax=Bernardetia sp. ABR2-2B TaxID=3127472 RepID=UPI0030D4595A